jgi:hypothetical protein
LIPSCALVVGLLNASCSGGGESSDGGETGDGGGDGGETGDGGNDGSGDGSGDVGETGDGGGDGGWSEPEIVTSAMDSPHLIVADAERIYWGSEDGTIHSLAHVGEDEETVLTSDQDFSWPGDMELDDTDLFWSTGEAVMKMSKSGGTPTEIASGQDYTDQLSLDDANVYFSTDSSFSRVGLSGGTVEVLAESDDDPSGISVSPTQALVALDTIGAIGVLPLDGGSIDIIASGYVSPKQTEVDGQDVFWAGGGDYSGDGTIWRSDHEGTAPELLADGLRWPHYLLPYGDYVYFSDIDAGLIARVAKDGGDLDIIADDQATPHDIAVSPPYVYWCNSGDGTVRRVTGSAF